MKEEKEKIERNHIVGGIKGFERKIESGTLDLLCVHLEPKRDKNQGFSIESDPIFFRRM